MATLTEVKGNRISWCDSAGMHSSHAVSLKTARVPYTITKVDVNRGWTAIPIVWNTPFEDLNYTVSWGIEDPGPNVNLDYVVGDCHFKTINGFTAAIYLMAPGKSSVGDVIYINATGFHE